MAVANQRRLPLHVPKQPEDAWLHDSALRRAKRLAAAVQAVEAVDLEAIASECGAEVGGSDLTTAATAAKALSAALHASLGGCGASGPADAVEAVQRELKQAAKRRERDARSAAWRAACIAEEGEAGEIARAMAHSKVDARLQRAALNKDSLPCDAETRRAEREARVSAAAGRRAIAEARAFVEAGKRSRSNKPLQSGSDLLNTSATSMSPVATDDPALRRARSLCSGAAGVVADLEEQSRQLLQRLEPASGGASAPPKAREGRPARSRPPAINGRLPEEDEKALVARANALLADYVPAETLRQQRRDGLRGKSAPRSARTPRSSGGLGLAGLPTRGQFVPKPGDWQAKT